MSIDRQSNGFVIGRLADDPQFTADIESITAIVLEPREAILLDFTGVRYINSSNLARLLRLRKRLIESDNRLVITGLAPRVMGVFQTTGLDKVFHFADTLELAIQSRIEP